MSLLDFLRQPSTTDVRGFLRDIPVRKGGILPLTEYGDGSARVDWTAGLPGSLYEAFTAPARAYRGEIAPDQMVPEGLNFAGTVALGSAGVPRPRASVGMGGKPAEVSSHLDMSPEARMARAREMGFDTKGYHWTGADFDEFKPHPYRGASFFGRTAEDAGRGATAGANDGTGTGSSKLREVMLPGGEVMGLALTPAERRWWSGLPERAGEEEITSILDQRPGDLSYGAKGMPWYQIYDEQRLPDGSFSYTKLPEPRLSWDEAAKSKYDVYGKQWPHYNPGSERFSSDYAKQHGMSGYTHQDEAGLAIGIVDPTRIRDVNAAFDPAKSSSANLLAANPETGAAPGLGLMAAAKQAEQPHEPPLMSILRAKGILP